MMRAVLLICVASVLWGQAPKPDLAERLWSEQNYQGANDAFRAFTSQHPKDVHSRVRWGRLFLERFDPSEARKLFTEALELDPGNAEAELAMGEVLEDSFSSEAVKHARLALTKDPKLYQAHELLARIGLEDNDVATATKEADEALAISPDALDALAVHAAIDLLDDHDAKQWLDKASARAPKNGKPLETVAHFLVINRRYEQGIQFYQKAVAVQPSLWSAHAELGLNDMRLGYEAQARKELDLAYKNHYTSSPVVNALRLMDSYAKFETFRSGDTILRFNKTEGAVLRPYFETELKRAMAVYEKKYNYKLKGPVQFEVFPDHEDFAVRTTGIPGLGALGVTFGNVVAMDSPSGRVPGSFHWASVMWHELSHVYTLSMTNFHVPRWFTEGVAVHEETAASPDWGDRVTPGIILAIKNKQLLKVSDLDRGFVHPKNSEQVLVSYFQGGTICDFIAKQWGEPKLTEMIHAFSGTATTAQVIQKTLGISDTEFDKRYLEYVEASTKNVVDNFDKWKKQTGELMQLAKQQKYDEVIARGPAIRDLYPDYVEDNSVYELIAKAYTSRNDDAGAAAELTRYWKAGGRSPAVLKQLADLLTKAQRGPEAAKVLESLIYIAPLDQELHVKLGELYLAQKNSDRSVREFQAVLAGKPIDEAGAHFHLAQAYKLAGKPALSRDELVAALEIAPGFRPAQKMLLETEGVPAR